MNSLILWAYWHHDNLALTNKQSNIQGMVDLSSTVRDNVNIFGENIYLSMFKFQIKQNISLGYYEDSIRIFVKSMSSENDFITNIEGSINQNGAIHSSAFLKKF